VRVYKKVIFIAITLSQVASTYANCDNKSFKLNYTNLYSITALSCSTYTDLKLGRNTDDNVYFHSFDITNTNGNISIKGVCAQKLDNEVLDEGSKVQIDLNTNRFNRSLLENNYVYIKGNIGLKDIQISLRRTSEYSRECGKNIEKVSLDKIYVGKGIIDILATQNNNALLTTSTNESWSQSYGKSVNFNTIDLSINSRIWHSETNFYNLDKGRSKLSLIISKSNQMSSVATNRTTGDNLFYKIPYTTGIKGCSTNSAIKNLMSLEDCQELREEIFNENANPKIRISKAERKKKRVHQSKQKIYSFVSKNFLKPKRYCETPYTFSHDCTGWTRSDKNRGHVVEHRNIIISPEGNVKVIEQLLDKTGARSEKTTNIITTDNGSLAIET
jgi:hypothetical protein